MGQGTCPRVPVRKGVIALIDVKNLTKRYGEFMAVDNISFEVKEGEIFSLLGPNGAGKTTTIEILQGLKIPTSGQVSVLGYDIYKEEKKIKEQIGVMPQNFNALERLSARENIQLVADIYGKGNKVEEVLELTGVSEFHSKVYLNLSGGMKTKVGIGMALVSDAPLLFLDEPTTGLDPQARREVWDMIEKLKGLGKTIMLTSHYMEEVERLSDRAAVMINGKIQTIGEISYLINNYGGHTKLTTRKDQNTAEILNREAQQVFEPSNGEDLITGVFDNKQSAKKAVIALYEKDYDVKIVEPSLEEAFISLSGSKINEKGELVS